MQITEQQILLHAPSPAVAESGRILSDEGRFSGRCHSADGLAFWAECAGSAKNPYSVSVDLALSEEEPVYCCSCASTHFPCKHALGLMYELLAGKPFTNAEPPSYLIKARAKEKTERERAAQRLLRARKLDATLRRKKLERQLEGLDKAERMAEELLRGGDDALDSMPTQGLERMATELGNNDLPGASRAFERIALVERRLHQPEEDWELALHRAELLRILSALWVLIQRGRALLTRQLESGGYAMEDPVLYELMGGAWNADELRDLGAVRKNARLVQLSFDVAREELRRTETERAFWLELGRGDLVYTVTERSDRAARCEGMEDSFFDLLEVPLLYVTPVASCPRVWWDAAAPQPLTAEERASLPGFAAKSIADAVEAARWQLREPLLPGYVPALIAVGSVGRVRNVLVLRDAAGGSIRLCDRREDGAARASTLRLAALPKPPAKGDALFGMIYYDEGEEELCLQPYSLVTAENVVRLQF